ncbi:MAG: hypothetical protein IK099_13370 [Clostridia bacterium]|nr:hypothetical protein [Clostridia bacterium]
MSNHSKARRQSMMIAFCGMAVGLSMVIMLLGGVIPAAAYAVPMLCGLLLLPILLEFGETAAWAAFFAVAALALMLDFDKEAAFFYLFIGYYPIVKWRLDRIKKKGLRFLVKTLLFTVSLAAMYALLALLFPALAVLRDFEEMGAAMSVLFAAAYLFCMLLYDRLLMGCVMIYANKIRPRLTFLK